MENVADLVVVRLTPRQKKVVVGVLEDYHLMLHEHGALVNEELAVMAEIQTILEGLKKT